MIRMTVYSEMFSLEHFGLGSFHTFPNKVGRARSHLAQEVPPKRFRKSVRHFALEGLYIYIDISLHSVEKRFFAEGFTTIKTHGFKKKIRSVL